MGVVGPLNGPSPSLMTRLESFKYFVFESYAYFDICVKYFYIAGAEVGCMLEYISPTPTDSISNLVRLD